MTRSAGSILTAVALCLQSGLALASEGRVRPNVVLIFADDLGFGDVSCYNPDSIFIEDDRVTELPTSMLEFEDKGGRPGPASPGWRHKFVMSAIFDKTIEFIGEHRREPFFVYAPLNSPHTPHAPADAFVGTSGLDVYGDFVVELDHHVGQVMQALSDLRLTENTLIIVTSDNGPETNMYLRLQQTGHDSSGLLLGSKRDNWEGGHRVPFIARWPGMIRAGSANSDPFSLVDMMATFADMLGMNLPDDQGVDSVTAMPLLKGESGAYRELHAIIHHSSGGYFAIRRGDWKLLLHSGSGGNNYGVRSGRRAEAYADTLEQRLLDTGGRQLYNLRLDIGETQNLASERLEMVAELTALALEYVKNGRSTRGPRQDYARENWPQIDWVE